MARESDMTGTTLSSSAAAARSTGPMAPPSLIVAEDPSPPSHSDLSVSTDLPQKNLSARADRSDIPAILVSTIIHTLLLIILALMSYQESRQGGGSLLARQGQPSNVVSFEAVQTDPTEDISLDGALSEQPVTISLSPTELETVSSPVAASDDRSLISDGDLGSFAVGGGGSTNKPLVRLPTGGGLSGRTPEGRKELGRQFGSTIECEHALENALQWLAEHQRPDGSWSFHLELDPCNGRCSHTKKGGQSPTPNTAATGLALLAFLGAGHTHQDDGPYSKTVRRGVYYLRGIAAKSELGLDWQQGTMYGHGIALMALAEAASMTSEGDAENHELFNLVKSGARFTERAQHQSGSWGYFPKSPGDMTVSGWQVLSLIAARRAGVRLEHYVFDGAKRFIMSTSNPNEYWFGYKEPPGEPTTTAIGLTLLLYLGEPPRFSPFYQAMTKMAQRGPTLTNVYHDYYATLALHHCRHPKWNQWNEKLRDHLVETQVKEGHEKGSWHFEDRWGDVGGRLYTTTMCALTLEVYYRYLPLYGDIEDFPL